MEQIVVRHDVENIEPRPWKPDIRIVERKRLQFRIGVEDGGRRDVAIPRKVADARPGIDLDTVVAQPLLLVSGQAITDDANTPAVVRRAQRYDERNHHLVPGLPVVVDCERDEMTAVGLVVV
ncbi:hypothetical protein [Burkholderia cenocepacia]|uniref:hypothetical protein n=1 Tax=Burkholderia cenocepacia TaxID=95486 RepID=UPI0028BAAC69|nr:hypothetical protein [Burkholderia cenocepacia]MDT6992855.1 hypothetical protein [Burkholderia cenocepacia]